MFFFQIDSFWSSNIADMLGFVLEHPHHRSPNPKTRLISNPKIPISTWNSKGPIASVAALARRWRQPSLAAGSLAPPPADRPPPPAAPAAPRPRAPLPPPRQGRTERQRARSTSGWPGRRGRGGGGARSGGAVPGQSLSSLEPSGSGGEPCVGAGRWGLGPGPGPGALGR